MNLSAEAGPFAIGATLAAGGTLALRAGDGA